MQQTAKSSSTEQPPVLSLVSENLRAKRNAVLTRHMDFWLLGGASLVVWALVLLAEYFKDANPAVNRHLLDLPVAFSVLTLVCNHPHFISSYKFGYGRGWKFIAQHWFALVAVPVSLLAIFIFAYLNFSQTTDLYPSLQTLNVWQESLSFQIHLGSSPNLGVEILSFSVWIMWLTVGWHYAKQIFGCMMLYSHYDGYGLSRLQRQAIKFNLFSVALVNFTYDKSYFFGPNSFMEMPVMQMSASPIIFALSCGVFGVSAGIITVIGLYKFVHHKQLPSLNFLVSGAAFYIWWIPGFAPAVYTAWAVPFFHSLQYLPFSYKALSAPQEKVTGPGTRRPMNLTVQILLILAIGALAFDIIPSGLDTAMDTKAQFSCAYFMIAFTVFINVHHFFIDSVTWRSDQPEFRESLL